VTRAQPRRRTVALIALAVGVLAIAGGVVWFQPQKLVINDRVDEAIPSAAGTSGGRAATRDPVVLAAGSFRPLGHATSGKASALRLSDGRRFLRLGALDTSNGPDLFVYLSAAAADGPRDSLDDDVVVLGRLKANQGNQNYEIPRGADLAKHPTVVIWCRRFTYAFGAAPLR
jgi:Electron transfer DM13